MKLKTILGALAICGVFTVHAQTTTTEKTIQRNADGTTTETTRTVTIEPEIRTKVVQYFEPYKTERFGLPPDVVTKFEVAKLPEQWRTVGITRGSVIEAENRTLLVKAPPKLVEILPSYPDQGYNVFLAGGNVVVVDPEFRVIDSIRIPTITFTTD